MKYYAGIGSRKTPEDILLGMQTLAAVLYLRGYTLRTGGAPGADQAFERGLSFAIGDRTSIQERSQIFLPYSDFELGNRTWIEPILDKPQTEAYAIAKQYHPRYGSLSEKGRSFHARNVHQIFGPDVNNPVYSEFVICWTPDGDGSGGTGQGIRIANDLNIPVYDLGKGEETITEVAHMVDSLE